MAWVASGSRLDPAAAIGGQHRMGQERSVPTVAQLHADHFDDVFRYVRRRLDRTEDAEDVAIEVLEAAYQQLPRFRGQCEPRLWLLGIARLKVARALRTRGRRPECAAIPADHVVSSTCDPHGEALRGESRSELRRIVSSLPEDQREALLLKHIEGLSLAEIAVVMARSSAAVSSLLQRARAAVYRAGRAYFVAPVEGTSYERA